MPYLRKNKDLGFRVGSRRVTEKTFNCCCVGAVFEQAQKRGCKQLMISFKKAFLSKFRKLFAKSPKDLSRDSESAHK